FVAKSRKVTFKVHIELLELINIPLVSGIFYAKWKLKNGVSASGCTSRAPISEHRVEWDHIISKQMELVVGKDGVLSPCELHLAIKQVMNQEKPRNLGVLVLNLAEYAKEGEVTRRYLLQESKSNSTLKITIRMDQIEGDVPFKTPCLK
ncbi:EEIG1/EHBP1 N-terminal domain-containing protein, partial [Dimargaris cristalligena]